MPRHGTRTRYRRYTCRCIGCQRGSHDKSIPDDLRWPLRSLEKFFGKDSVAAWFEEDQIADWKENGLTDEDADMAAIKLGGMPNDVWSGYLEAGFDFPQYP